MVTPTARSDFFDNQDAATLTFQGCLWQEKYAEMHKSSMSN